MIIQTGMRTDIPAFYAKWLANRIKAGYVLVRNPYNPQQVTRYRLQPDVVDLLTFCTKNPQPMLPYMDRFQPFRMYWFVTITPYGKDIEPHVPDKQAVLQSFRTLSKLVGPDAVGWRYDPVLLNENYTVHTHLQAFQRMAEYLDGYTKTCVISFVDRYEKVKRNFPEVSIVGHDDRLYLGQKMIEIAARHGMTVKPCGEGTELETFGADCSGCMSKETYEQVLGSSLDFPKKTPLRKECSCFLGSDIGAYNTCPHLCRYCYANYDKQTVLQNFRRHDPASPFLIGDSLPGDEVHQAEQQSWINGQMRLQI